MEYDHIQLRDLLQTIDASMKLSVETLTRWLETQRDRKIELVPWAVPASISGAWISTATTDYIFYDESVPRMYREHIQMNHLGRLLLNHTTLIVHEGKTFDDNDLQRVAFRGVFNQLSKGALTDMINYILSLQQKERQS